MPDTQTPPTPLALKDLITEAGLADRAYLKDFADKPLDKETGLALLKKLDGAESLIGRKIGIPANDAKPEEVEKFYSTLRPEKPEDYEIVTGEKPDEEFIKALRVAAHKGGISKHSMKVLSNELGNILKARAQKAAEAQANADKEFDQLVSTAFGADKDKVLERVKGALEEHAPAAVKAHIGRLDDKSLVLVAGVVDAIIKKYTPEDKMGGKGGGTGLTPESIREEARKLMASPEYKSQFHPKHDEVVKKVNELYAALPK